MLDGKRVRPMAEIGKFQVDYTHRGSWKASCKVAGKIVHEVPVAWESDLTNGNPSTLSIWFKDDADLAFRLAEGKPFLTALVKNSGKGSSSSKNITRLFEVQPIGLIEGRGNFLHCAVVR